MKSDKLKFLYVCTDFPYPPIHGGLVDMWNRIQVLHGLGVTLDVVVTAAQDPPNSDRETVEKVVRRLIFAKRRRGIYGLFSIKPGQTVIRSDLRSVKLEDEYDAVLMQTEFTTDILLNKTLKRHMAIIRVENDEYAYYLLSTRDERLADNGAVSLLLWKALQLVGQRNCGFDFDGFYTNGTANFVRQFGAEVVPRWRVTRMPRLIYALREVARWAKKTDIPG